MVNVTQIWKRQGLMKMVVPEERVAVFDVVVALVRRVVSGV
jgi:hypothetical protein